MINSSVVIQKVYMKTLSKKICPICNAEFVFESWNKDRIFCSRKCKDSSRHPRKATNEEFIKKAIEKHGNRYSYILTDVDKKINGKIKIICEEHGEFWQEPNQHLVGKGCKKCANEKLILTTEQFIEKSKRKHKGKYIYDLTEYKSMKEHVVIICPDHGPFQQSPTQHIHHGTGCHICAQIYTSSRGENDWLDSLGVPNDKEHRQVEIRNQNYYFRVDGLDGETILEYLGDFWHGNPNLYSRSEINILNKKSYGQLYDETLRRFDNLRLLGYDVKYIWESDWYHKKESKFYLGEKL
jgi:hypothetical protein